jgi:predicted small integral membrane protein
MAWTWPTAIFFVAILIGLMTMTIVELRWPGQDRRGFLPMVTSRGDRFFISLLSAAFLHLIWLGLTTLPVLLASLMALLLAAVIMRWG